MPLPSGKYRPYKHYFPSGRRLRDFRQTQAQQTTPPVPEILAPSRDNAHEDNDTALCLARREPFSPPARHLPAPAPSASTHHQTGFWKLRWACLRDKPESCLCIHQPDIASVLSPREISPLDHIYFMSGVLFSR